MKVNVSLGLDIGGTKCMVVAQIEKKKVFQRVGTGPEFSTEDFQACMKDFLIKLKDEHKEIVVNCVGIAICGLTNTEGTIVLCELPKLAGWNPIDSFKVLLEEMELSSHSLKAVVVNDAQAAMLEVKHTFVDPDADTNIVVIIVGTGIGTSFLVEGTILKGSKGWAGCFGTAPIMISTTQSSTLDQLAGGRHILKKVQEEGYSVDDLCQVLIKLKQEGNIRKEFLNEEIKHQNQLIEKKLLKIILDAGYALGIGLSTILNIFNPSLIVLAGGVLNFPGYLDAALQSAKENTNIVGELWSQCKIVESEYRNELVAVGALRAGLDLK